ncbi:hypothetical protein N752_21450 [Desulforamulus aquiferis]|nr:hypothetical protein N752_21450 [Desulforamulus aquiferis]
MDERVKNYYKRNHLYASKMILPDTGEKFRHSCNDCTFLSLSKDNKPPAGCVYQV